MTSKKIFYLIEKSGQVAAGKELGGDETSTATGARERFSQADHYIDLTRGIVGLLMFLLKACKERFSQFPQIRETLDSRQQQLSRTHLPLIGLGLRL